jgi:hypothetical protein
LEGCWRKYLGRRTRRLSLRERELVLPLAEALARQADLENPICLMMGRPRTRVQAGMLSNVYGMLDCVAQVCDRNLPSFLLRMAGRGRRRKEG